MYIVLYIKICQVWCSSIQGIYAQLMGGQSAMGIYALFYIYRPAKFGVGVFKISMLDCLGVNLPWVYVHCSIYIYMDLP